MTKEKNKNQLFQIHNQEKNNIDDKKGTKLQNLRWVFC